MSKNKLKFVIFAFIFLFFSLTKVNEVSAQEYNVSVSNVEGLVYGNKLKDARVIGISEIPGEFTFFNQNQVLENIGEVDLEVVFTPFDLENYSSKKINIRAIVNRRRISVVFVSPLYKQYDGTVNIDLKEYTYSGIINDEVSIEGELAATLSASYVGEDIDVILSGIEIKGEKKNYYYLDLLEHSARVYPAFLEKLGDDHTVIALDKDLYVDIDYELKVKKVNVNENINDKYTSFYKVNYEVYDNVNNLIDINSNYRVIMNIDESIVNRERFHLFELTSDGEYKEIKYSYSDNKISFAIKSDSCVIFATRNIEYNLIMLFSGILLFYLLFIIVYRIKNSRIKVSKRY